MSESSSEARGCFDRATLPLGKQTRGSERESLTVPRKCSSYWSRLAFSRAEQLQSMRNKRREKFAWIVIKCMYRYSITLEPRREVALSCYLESYGRKLEKLIT